MDALLRRRAMIAAGGGEPPTPPVIEPVFYDRLVFDGTAYIDTDIIPDANASYKTTLGNESSKVAQRILTVKDSSSTLIGAILNNSTSATNRCFSIYYGSSSALSTDKTLAWTTSEYNFFLTPKRFGIADSVYSITKGNRTPAGGIVIGSNYQHSGNPYSGDTSTIFVYGSDAQNVETFAGFDSYTPAYTLRPCTFNGEAGLWCVETSTFYGNTAGSGTLSVRNNS